MVLAYDPQIEATLLAARARYGAPQVHARGDWAGLRATVDTMMAAMARAASPAPGVSVTRHEAIAPDGTPVALHWYTSEPAGIAHGPAVVYLHGGGMICGSVALYDSGIRDYVAASGVPMLAVDYRLAPEHPHPVPIQDCFASLAWLVAQAEPMGIDPARIAVMGDSAGGGLAACVALMARDRNIALARQILVYPMLDDRNLAADPAVAPFATWSWDDNGTGWGALLGPQAGAADVPEYAAAARAGSLAGLAPAYIDVGDLDIFCREDIAYAGRLAAAGVQVELHVHPGAPHGFTRIAPLSDVAQRALADRCRALRAV